MKLHIITIGTPKLAYARAGWDEYLGRLQRFHAVRVTHLHDKWANDITKIQGTTKGAFTIALVIDGKELSSPELASFLEQRALEGREVCFIIGGPEGLPESIQTNADMQWSFSPLTFPHDLAMVILAEALYRASTITANVPYHK